MRDENQFFSSSAFSHPLLGMKFTRVLQKAQDVLILEPGDDSLFVVDDQTFAVEG